jgi:hypothetical protein
MRLFSNAIVAPGSRHSKTYHRLLPDTEIDEPVNLTVPSRGSKRESAMATGSAASSGVQDPARLVQLPASVIG